MLGWSLRTSYSSNKTSLRAELASKKQKPCSLRCSLLNIEAWVCRQEEFSSSNSSEDCRQGDSFSSPGKLGLSSKSLSLSLSKSLGTTRGVNLEPRRPLDLFTISQQLLTCLTHLQTWPNSAWRCQAG